MTTDFLVQAILCAGAGCVFLALGLQTLFPQDHADE